MFTPQSIVYAWDNQLNYAMALVADLRDEHMLVRPGGNMNHPAWILGHASLYHPAVVALLSGAPVDDPRDNRVYGYAGQGPVDELSVYGSRDEIVGRFAAGHERVAQALLNAKPSDFTRRPSLQRWAEAYPTVEFMLPDLLISHESQHLGQLSIWRRAAGLPGVKTPPREVRPGLIKR